jgi:hypothetical protein
VASVTAQDVIHARSFEVPSIFRIAGAGPQDPPRLFLAPSPGDKVRNAGKRVVNALD